MSRWKPAQVLIGLICRMPIQWVARPGVCLSIDVWQGFDCCQNNHSGCLVCCIKCCWFIIATIQDCFWDEHLTWRRKVWNSGSALTRETGWFFSNYLIPLIFCTDSLFTCEAVILAFPVGRMYFKVPISSKFLFSYLILYLTQWTSAKEKNDLDKMQSF